MWNAQMSISGPVNASWNASMLYQIKLICVCDRNFEGYGASMGIIFGKKKKPTRVTEQDKAVLQLKQQRDKLKQYQKKVEFTLSTDREIAKKLLNHGQKDRAKLLLKKKRFQEQLLIKLDGQLENLEKLASDIEFSQVEIQVIEGLKTGNDALKKVNESIIIEDIERILDETKEGIDKQNEINELLSGQLTEEDEAAVEEELAAIINEEMPAVPSEQPQMETHEDILEKENKLPEKLKKTEEKERIAVLVQ
ncbi:charged multivesicular body protein 6-A isoform X1 [Diorhabda sublineata]|uniref:charged multivesicular body protein 6-A isoform X1 n=1 Tax=Diorhabda sublineata TaxID=1163346 RepID=UPI0024E0F5E4|nr:charged multivesicular body protein 6-A isoform X1 [Diorhabda sublineata]